jgi:uncharacterized protein (TIGR02145 family)
VDAGNGGSFTDLRDGRTYRTVRIGKQTWMAENLRFRLPWMADDSLCPLCEDYGRGYDFLPGLSYYDDSTPSIRGICPEGWHGPSALEWASLVRTVEADPRVGNGRAGWALKSRTDWMESGTERELGNGSDLFGFRALPSGTWKWPNDGGDPGSATGWWALEGDGLHADATSDSLRQMPWGYGTLSIRCVADFADTADKGPSDSAASTLVPSVGRLVPAFSPDILQYDDTVDAEVGHIRFTVSPRTPDEVRLVTGADKDRALEAAGPTDLPITLTNLRGDTLTYTVRVVRRTPPWNPAVAYESLTDPRDGQTYRTVRLAGHSWMAENLNFSGGGSMGSCYGGQDAYCATFGRLYTWSEAAGGVCPAGWHLPSPQEWTDLTTWMDRADLPRAMKATSGWVPNGTDAFGFRGLPGGWGLEDGSFERAGVFGGWWTSQYGLAAKLYTDSFGSDDLRTWGSLLSVRCLQ